MRQAPPLAQQAQLDKAYAQYKGGEKAQAIATLDRFMKLHPPVPRWTTRCTSRAWSTSMTTSDCSPGFRAKTCRARPKAAKDSFESFNELVTRFPESRYAQDSRQRMTYIVNSLAQYEVHVAATTTSAAHTWQPSAARRWR